MYVCVGEGGGGKFDCEEGKFLVFNSGYFLIITLLKHSMRGKTLKNKQIR
jgi:hypothetical protein